MRYYESGCVDCGFSCRSEACPYYKITVFKCDFCKEEDVKLYHYYGHEICEECLLKEFDIVEGSD